MVIRRIVVGSDGSPHAQRAVVFTAELAHQLRAEVLLVHAAGNVAPARASASDFLKNVAQNGGYGDDDSVERVVRSEWARPLIAARVPWGVDVRYGWAPDVLTKTAEQIGAQLIVIGAGSRETSGDGRIGSVGYALSQRPVVPLIVVPEEAPSIVLHAVEQRAVEQHAVEQHAVEQHATIT